jgi:hypothetical protein
LVLIDLTAAGTSSAKLKGLGSLGSRLSDRFWNYPLARKAMVAAVRRMPLRFFKRMPTIIVIDVTNSCNLRCPVCPVTFAMHRPRGLMPLDRFKGIVEAGHVLQFLGRADAEQGVARHDRLFD